jgi:hypothetical protein
MSSRAFDGYENYTMLIAVKAAFAIRLIFSNGVHAAMNRTAPSQGPDANAERDA